MEQPWNDTKFNSMSNEKRQLKKVNSCGKSAVPS